MYNIPDSVKQAFFDGESNQDLRIIFQDATLTASGGDIEATGAVFRTEFSCDEDLTLGSTVAATFSASLLNESGKLSGLNFGEARVEIGVQVNEQWTYIPMGYYYIERPVKINDAIIDVSDALDRMRLFEVDALPFIESLTYPTTVNSIFTALCTYVGITAESQSFQDISVPINPFPTSCSLRDILSWIAESRHRSVKINRTGKVEFFWLSESSVETVPEEFIMGDSSELAEYQTEPVTKTVIKALTGVNYNNGVDGNTYYVLGNPFMSSQDLNLLQFIQTFPQYVPFSTELIYTHPAFDCGDLITLQVPEDIYLMYVTTINGSTYAVTDEDGVVYGADGTAVRELTLPLMQQELTWDGICHSVITATGNQTRPLQDEKEFTVNAVSAPEGLNSRGNLVDRLNGLADATIAIDPITGELLINATGIKADTVLAEAIEAKNLKISGGEFAVSAEATAQDADTVFLNFVLNIIAGTLFRAQFGSQISHREIKTISHIERFDGTVIDDSDNLINANGLRNDYYNHSESTGHSSIAKGGAFKSIDVANPKSSAPVEHERMNLDGTGMTFKDTSGNVTATYPSDHVPGTAKTIGAGISSSWTAIDAPGLTGYTGGFTISLAKIIGGAISGIIGSTYIPYTFALVSTDAVTCSRVEAGQNYAEMYLDISQEKIYARTTSACIITGHYN